NCLPDSVLVRALRASGHDACILPMYLPIRTADAADVVESPVFFGGINVYLQQKFRLFRRTPAWVDRLFNSAWLLKLASRKAGMTMAKGLGEMTVSMLKGRDGRQAKELDKLVDHFAGDRGIDVVCLSNALLAAVAGPIRERLDAAVVCFLQDEDGWLDALPDPYRQQAWHEMSRRVASVDALVAVSDYYKGVMEERLGVPPGRIVVVRPGIRVDGYSACAEPPPEPVIGYLSPACEAKGLGLLVDAFALLKGEGRIRGNLRLRVAGGNVSDSRAFMGEIRRRLAEGGLHNDVEFLGNLDRGGRQEFLRSLTVLSVPTLGAEAYGLFVLEALASGVPVVEPRHGAFPELIELTGGGLLCEPGDARSLADALERLLGEPDLARDLGRRGREAVLQNFSAERMAADVMHIFETVVERPLGEQSDG
ncbi:MAG: glycosyltransferase family 4 protein, partial [Planctomycetia bacterium]|nr:glycosyltransferase family 4 protein [Planctomycetia bacterium]